jgi:hypothetical protein
MSYAAPMLQGSSNFTRRRSWARATAMRRTLLARLDRLERKLKPDSASRVGPTTLDQFALKQVDMNGVAPPQPSPPPFTAIEITRR